MSTYRVHLYLQGRLVSVMAVRAESAALATALVAGNHPECEAIGEG